MKFSGFIRRLFANVSIVLSLMVLTLSIIDLVNDAINMLDNPLARWIVLIFAFASAVTGILYLIDIFSERFRKNKDIGEDFEESDE